MYVDKYDCICDLLYVYKFCDCICDLLYVDKSYDCILICCMFISFMICCRNTTAASVAMRKMAVSVADSSDLRYVNRIKSKCKLLYSCLHLSYLLKVDECIQWKIESIEKIFGFESSFIWMMCVLYNIQVWIFLYTCMNDVCFSNLGQKAWF